MNITFTNLPPLGGEMDGCTFAGITTRQDGTHCAVMLLPNRGEKLTWKKALNWAKKLDGELPSRPVASLLFSNIKSKLQSGWHWTNEEDGASSAWGCTFGSGGIGSHHKSFEGSAVAVRLIPITA